ncbi:MAG: hypothetical protein NWF10_08110 [Candidatus Bathyarchaeota archaeon]|nr:hypothetical protein [Candidatus Bathyarchaeota archaeon]
MKHYVRKSTLTILILILAVYTFSCVHANSGFSIESTSLQIYRDGLAYVKQTLTVEELYPQIVVPLLSTSVENLVIIDQNQKPLDYEISNNNLTVFTLGSTQVTIEYETLALTNKEAEVWSLNIDYSFSTTVSLPKNSTVIYLSEMPNAIDTLDNEITFTLHPNQWEISYILPPSSIDDSTNGRTDQNLIPIEYFILVIGSIILLIILLFIFLKRRKPNVKKIFKAYPQLSKEDKAVIQFLADNDGNAFEAEIRVAFPDMPRTSLWRLVRRLERLEIVDVNKIGLENQVKLR